MNRGKGVVIKVSYPFSLRRYDQVYKLFDQAHFQLINHRVGGSKPLELYVAPTMLELQHVTGVPIIPHASEIKGNEADDEPPKAIDLFSTKALDSMGSPPTLVPAACFDLRQRLAEEAATRARDHLTRPDVGAPDACMERPPHAAPLGFAPMVFVSMSQPTDFPVVLGTTTSGGHTLLAPPRMTLHAGGGGESLQWSWAEGAGDAGQGERPPPDDGSGPGVRWGTPSSEHWAVVRRMVRNLGWGYGRTRGRRRKPRTCRYAGRKQKRSQHLGGAQRAAALGVRVACALAYAAQYTDDSVQAVLTPEAMLHYLVCFARLIGPVYHPSGGCQGCLVAGLGLPLL